MKSQTCSGKYSRNSSTSNRDNISHEKPGKAGELTDWLIANTRGKRVKIRETLQGTAELETAKESISKGQERKTKTSD